MRAIESFEVPAPPKVNYINAQYGLKSWLLTKDHKRIALLYLAVVGSVIAFLLYYWLVLNMDVTKSMLISLVTPVVAVLLGMIVLNEQIGWRTLAGGAMIMLGIALIVVRKARKPDSKKETLATSVAAD